MKRSLLAIAATFAMASAALAQQPPSNESPEALQMATRGGMTVDKKFPAAAGLTGWVMQDRGRQLIVYTTADGKHLIAGNLVDVSGRNLTKVYSDEHFVKPDLDKYWTILGKDASLVKEGAADKDAKAIFYVFTDPNCPYCHAAWEQFQPYMKKGLQVRWITVGILGQSSKAKAAEILSAKDPLATHKAHNEAFRTTKGVQGIAVSDKMDKVLDKHQSLMRELGLSGTPGIVYLDKKGRVVTSPGLPSAAALTEMTGIR